MKEKYCYKWIKGKWNFKPKAWYNEYRDIRIHDYFSLIVNQFPILVVRKYDLFRASDNDKTIDIGLLGMTFSFRKILQRKQ
jgi:hypothetical protein